jgi:tetraacyldisaccharide 4'-kinase
MVRWLWTSPRIDARLVRLALLPVAAGYGAVMRVRASAYARGWFDSHALPLPSISVGNLTVGGSGKTPIAIWVARYAAAKGLKPGILLRGYAGGDEAKVHERAVAGSVVVVDPDRRAGAERARTAGAQILILDDAFQRLDVRRDLNICVVSAETTRAVPWSLPAGPWREGFGALARADAVVVTRKRAPAEAAQALAEELRGRFKGPVAVAHLGLSGLEGLVSGKKQPASLLNGKRVVAAAAIGDPDSFVGQLKAAGAAVQVATWRDHHQYGPEDLAWLAKASRKSDHLVITEKDAVKLRDRWPAGVQEPLVAQLDLAWDVGEEGFVGALDAVVSPTRSLLTR